jgi:hypothetical protein
VEGWVEVGQVAVKVEGAEKDSAEADSVGEAKEVEADSVGEVREAEADSVAEEVGHLSLRL